MEIRVSSVLPREQNSRSSSNQPKAKPSPRLFSKLAEKRALEPNQRPTFTRSFTTAEAGAADSKKKVTTNEAVKSFFFMEPP